MHASVSFYFAWALLPLRTALDSVFCATAVEASCDVFAESGKRVSCCGGFVVVVVVVVVVGNVRGDDDD